MKLQTKIKIQESYHEFVGGCYNSMLDEDDEYLLEVKDLFLDLTKLKEEIYQLTVSSLRSYDKNIKFDGKQAMMDYISSYMLDDAQDIMEIHKYIKKLVDEQ